MYDWALGYKEEFENTSETIFSIIRHMWDSIKYDYDEKMWILKGLIERCLR